MSLINYASREINCKLVYYGPGLGGKTTNLEYIYEKVAPTDVTDGSPHFTRTSQVNLAEA